MLELLSKSNNGEEKATQPLSRDGEVDSSTSSRIAPCNEMISNERQIRDYHEPA